MEREETRTQGALGSEPELAADSQPATSASPRKIEANRRNAQHSTGPKTAEGKAKSSQNAIKHGIFFKQLVNGASPETVAELETLAADMREYYQPIGRLEEMLVEKIVVENARYARILGFEQEELSRRYAFFGAAVDRVGRYTTSTSRALFRAIEELDRVQAARKARDLRSFCCPRIGCARRQDYVSSRKPISGVARRFPERGATKSRVFASIASSRASG